MFTQMDLRGDAFFTLIFSIVWYKKNVGTTGKFC